MSGTGESPTFDGTFGYENPVGTGPFQFESWERGSEVTLTRYDDYWGEPAQLDELIFTVIPDGPAVGRPSRQATSTATTWSTRRTSTPWRAPASRSCAGRPSMSATSGSSRTWLRFDNLQIRQAIAHAINKENLIQTNYPEGTVVATQFMPPELFGWADDVATYDYDPDRATAADRGVGRDEPDPAVLVSDRRVSGRTCPTRRPTGSSSRPISRQSASRSKPKSAPVESRLPRCHPNRGNTDVPAGMDG